MPRSAGARRTVLLVKAPRLWNLYGRTTRPSLISDHPKELTEMGNLWCTYIERERRVGTE